MSSLVAGRMQARYERAAAARAAAGVGGRARSLVEASVKTETMRRYKRAVVGLLDWCEALGLTFSTVEDVDDLLTDYFQWLWDSGRPREHASSALYGIAYHAPALRCGPLPARLEQAAAFGAVAAYALGAGRGRCFPPGAARPPRARAGRARRARLPA